MRSASRIVGVSINTVMKLLVDAGEACSEFHHQNVRDVHAKRVQCDEIWSFCYAKRHNVGQAVNAPVGSGDVWTWTAIDSHSKLIISWFVGDRDMDAGLAFMDDLRFRLADRVQLTTDGHPVYPDAIEVVFGSDVDYARRFMSQQSGVQQQALVGNPNPSSISTSHVERHNLTMRMSMRRFTRSTNGFSKKLENHCSALALYFYWYNWCRPHMTLGMPPAMAAGLAPKPMTLDRISKLAL